MHSSIIMILFLSLPGIIIGGLSTGWPLLSSMRSLPNTKMSFPGCFPKHTKANFCSSELDKQVYEHAVTSRILVFSVAIYITKSFSVLTHAHYIHLIGPLLVPLVWLW